MRGGASQGVRLVGRVGRPQEPAAAVSVAGPELAVPGAGEGDAVHALPLPLQVPVHLQPEARQLPSLGHAGHQSGLARWHCQELSQIGS